MCSECLSAQISTKSSACLPRDKKERTQNNIILCSLQVSLPSAEGGNQPKGRVQLLRLDGNLDEVANRAIALIRIRK